MNNSKSNPESPTREHTKSAHERALTLMANWISALADQAKNPVAGISAAANIIDKQIKSFRQSQTMDIHIVEEALLLMRQRLTSFDNYLSELSGYAKETAISPIWHDLAAKWHDIESHIRKRAASSFKLNVNLKETGEQSIQFFGEIESLKKICTAIIINSVEACGASIDPEISLNFSKRESHGNSPGGLELTFIDNGPGFSEAAIQQATTPFFTTKEAGTGLGLAMVVKHLKLHNGSIKLTNNVETSAPSHPPDKSRTGAKVWIFIPYPAS